MNKYILEPQMVRELHAGSKAREDINLFLSGADYTPIVFFVNDTEKFLLKVTNYVKCISNLNSIINKMGPNSIVLLQYPYPFSHYVFEFIINKLTRRGSKVVALVHDVNALRFLRGEADINQEITYLNSFHYVITHNPHMSKWLLEHGLKTKVHELGVFDYSMTTLEKIEKKFFSTEERTLIFAGNLSPNKSQFIYLLNDEMLKDFNINLYGVEYEEDKIRCKKIIHKGVFEPDELPQKMEGDFGLIWDGTDINTCAGDFGQYLRFNNPHKLSLYIAAGLPIITWKKAAISSFISNNRLGVLIDSLTEVSDAISEINHDKYLELKENVLSFQHKVTTGHFIKNAVKSIEDSFNKEQSI